MTTHFTMPVRARIWRVLVLSTLILSGCGAAKEGNAPASVVDKIRSTHRLHAAYVQYYPFVIKDANSGKLSGYFIDLMNEIASAGQFSIDYEESTWGTMVAGLEGGRYDLVVSGIFPTIPRSFAASFARPIMYVGLSAVIPAKDKTSWTQAQLRRPGLRIAVINGEVGHEYLKRYLPAATAIVLDTADISRAAVEVSAGRADIAIAESITMVEFAARNPDVRTLFVNDPLEVYGSTVMTRRGDQEWIAFLNTSIDLMEASGRLHQLEEKYKSRPDMWQSRSLPWK